MKRLAWAALAACIIASPVLAADGRGTADDAKVLVQKAVAYLKANGPDKTYEAITKQDPQFLDRDLYVYIGDMKGVTLANGFNAKLVGKDMSDAQDTDGKLYTKERLEKAKTQKSFWVDYKFTNPVSKKIEPKSTYCEVQETTMVCCGFYK